VLTHVPCRVLTLHVVCQQCPCHILQTDGLVKVQHEVTRAADIAIQAHTSASVLNTAIVAVQTGLKHMEACSECVEFGEQLATAAADVAAAQTHIAAVVHKDISGIAQDIVQWTRQLGGSQTRRVVFQFATDCVITLMCIAVAMFAMRSPNRRQYLHGIHSSSSLASTVVSD
jgi:hypothetical protein